MFVREVLAGVERYQNAARVPRCAAQPVIASQRGAQVLDYGGNGPPVLFIPSIINPPHVLDLSEDNSLLRWLATQGVRPLLLDWGSSEARHDLSLAGHVEEILLPLVEGLGPDLSVAGYCLGGTMAVAVATRAPVRSAVLMAAPWDFAGYAPDARARMPLLWETGRPVAEAVDTFPMELLQTAFWSLDPDRTFGKYRDFARAEPGSSAARGFVVLEDWANDGPSLPLPAARELLEDFYGLNRPGEGSWDIAGGPVRLEDVSCPVLNIISSTDRIVPEASAAALGEPLVLDLGHVGMVVSRNAPERLWSPLASWLSRLRHK